MTLSAAPAILFTCEHGGNRVPAAYAQLFAGWEESLNSHRGWDPGAIHLAKSLARRFDVPLIASTVSRLVVELNRSAHHRSVLSDVTRQLSRAEQQELLNRWYHPYRNQVVETVERLLASTDQSLLHIGVHSFTPVLNGVVRKGSIGLLYDPRYKQEREFCSRWQHHLQQLLPDQRVRRNDPYRGRDDGLTTALRRRFSDCRYLGIELEVNQGQLDAGGRLPRAITTAIGRSLQRTLSYA